MRVLRSHTKKQKNKKIMLSCLLCVSFQIYTQYVLDMKSSIFLAL